MNVLKQKLAALFLFCGALFFALLPGFPSEAASNLVPTAASNLDVGLRKSSSLVATSSGYMRVFYLDDTVHIEYYDNNFNIQSKKTLAMDLDLWGGFYAGSNAYYLVEGKANTAESDTAEVIRVIKYDTNWRRIGVASITSNPDLFGGDVRYPFDYGCVEFAEQGGTLYIVTGHEGYVDEAVGQGHQGFLMIAVNTSTMEGKIVRSDLWHSFAQYIKCNGSDLYVLEQSEGSRCTTLTKYNADTLDSQKLSVLDYGGAWDSVWAINCYASVDGMEISGSNVLCIGTSIDQSKYDSVTSDTPHNIYLTVTPLSNFSEDATTVKWLTSYTGGGKSFLGVKLTKINDNRFLVSWEETSSGDNASTDDSLSGSILHYVFLDGNGNKIGKEYTSAAPISECQPIVKDSKVVYYASNGNMVNFYSINAQTGSASKKAYRVAGENATWKYSNGVLTISGSGEVSVPEESYRSPLSTTSYSSVYYPGRWKSLQDKVKKIVIKKGITAIADECFSSFSSLTEVEIESGLKRIGEKAFYNCGNLEKITIPASVTSIGDDILWTGSYWVGDQSHVVYAAIHTEYNSQAAKYAKRNGITYYLTLDNAKISGVRSSYTFAGKAVEPSTLKVKIGSRTLKKGTEYKVSYSNNTKPGTATLKVTGTGRFEGTLSVKFKITSPAVGTKLTDSKTKSVYTVTKKGSTVAYTSAKNVKSTSLTIPSKIKLKGVTYKVTAISDNALGNNKRLKNVTIGGSVTSIGAGAFSGCTALQKVQIGSGVKSIDTKAFYGCKKLTSVTLGKNVTSIGTSAFANCTSLTKITLPSKVAKIGSRAFYNCSRLTSITIKTEKLTSGTVKSSAFTKAGSKNYKKLTVTVPKAKKTAYKKLLRQRGISVKAKFK